MLNLDSILSRRIPASTKGAPAALADNNLCVTVANVGDQSWNLLVENLPLPVAVLRESRLAHNQAWMKQYLDDRGVWFAPHGKTTMSPQLFDMQLRNGAWAITVASVQQLKVCREFGVQRVLLANQLLGRDDIRFVTTELNRDSTFEFFCLVDSVEGVHRLDQATGQADCRPLSVLVEVGMVAGRTGSRNLDEATAVAKEVSKSRNLELAGVECYEGIAVTEDYETDTRRVNALLTLLISVYQFCLDNALFYDTGPIILSAGGSSYFDIVAKVLPPIARDNTIILIRSGCYLTHDSLFYKRLVDRMSSRSGGDTYDLKSALEIWGYIQSVPEPGLAILNVGKRDVAHDINLPVVEQWFRPGEMTEPVAIADGLTITALNDHHAYVKFSNVYELSVGDMLALGISHPCTTFDKWQFVWIVDDSYAVISGVWTYF